MPCFDGIDEARFTGGVLDDPSPGTPDLVIFPGLLFDLANGTREIVFEVYATPWHNSLDITFNFITNDGTAKEGVDYTLTSGTALIPPGETVTYIHVPVAGEANGPTSLLEFSVTISSPNNATISVATATGLISYYGQWPTLPDYVDGLEDIPYIPLPGLPSVPTGEQDPGGTRLGAPEPITGSGSNTWCLLEDFTRESGTEYWFTSGGSRTLQGSHTVSLPEVPGGIQINDMVIAIALVPPFPDYPSTLQLPYEGNAWSLNPWDNGGFDYWFYPITEDLTGDSEHPTVIVARCSLQEQYILDDLVDNQIYLLTVDPDDNDLDFYADWFVFVFRAKDGRDMRQPQDFTDANMKLGTAYRSGSENLRIDADTAENVQDHFWSSIQWRAIVLAARGGFYGGT
jgi:hypothetical protein